MLGEESPDSIGQGVLVLCWETFWKTEGMESATENIPSAAAGKGEKAV